MSIKIEFPDFPEASWDHRVEVRFPADVDGRRVWCRVSEEALLDNFQPGPPLEAFGRNRAVFEAKAKARILAEDFESDRSVLITSRDLRK